jgi:membrane-bound lytic murein transglycosylase B
VPAAGPALATQIPAPQIQKESYAQWIADFKREALASGVSPLVLDNAFADVTAPLDDVLRLDQTQPEKTKTFDQYIKSFLTDARLNAALEQWDTHAQVLSDVQKTYGVPAPILLALWQTESRFGEHQGNFSIVSALATLAYDGRRSAFFRKELMNAMLILQQEHIDAHMLTGSWAGAMGQVQFMPSSFLAYAVDFDGDGRKDIWNSDADALASMANYLSTKGWDGQVTWGVHVDVPEGGPVDAWVQSKEKHSIQEWRKMGIRGADGKRLPRLKYDVRLVMPDSNPSQAYLVTKNYDVLMDWNRSVYFATAVGLEADAIAHAHAP